MNITRNVVHSIVIAAALAAPVIASAESTAWSIPDPAPFGTEQKSAAQVKQELVEFQANPVSADGRYRFAGFEIGWVPVPHEIAVRNGRLAHVDKLGHSAKAPSLEMTEAEKRQREAMFRG